MEVMEKMKVLIRASIFEVFEKMFFIFLEPGNENQHGFSMEAKIEFTGPMNGDITLSLTDGMATLMAKNMLSLEDPDIPDSLKEDCALEALNMVCGNLLRTYDCCQVYNLSIPKFKKNKNLKLILKDEWEHTNSLLSIFDSEEESLAVLLKFKMNE